MENNPRAKISNFATTRWSLIIAAASEGDEQTASDLADQEQGRFRAFLLGALKNYVAKQWRKDHQLKRGGFSEHLSIDWQSAEEGLKFEPAHQLSPDKLFDRDWAHTLLEKVLDDLSAEEGDHSEVPTGEWRVLDLNDLPAEKSLDEVYQDYLERIPQIR